MITLRLISLAMGILGAFGGELQAGSILRHDMFKEKSIDPNAKSGDGLPIIFEAVLSRDAEWVEKLIDAGADIEARGFGHATPALVAALGDVWDVCLFLLRRGADPSATNQFDMTIFNLAAESRVAEDSTEGKALQTVIKFLEEKGLKRYRPAEVKALKAEGKWPPTPTK